MFTGIIEETGVIQSVATGRSSIRLTLQADRTARGLRKGDSLAVNGCCLTVAALGGKGRGRWLQMDLLKETWKRTNLRFAAPGRRVNLERALPAAGRFGGHFVTGHIEATGKITRWERVKKDWLLEIAAPSQIMRYVIPKGSIAVDGISLTVASRTKTRFQVWIIPHTYAATAMPERRKGDAVNLESDLLGKYVEQFLSGAAG